MLIHHFLEKSASRNPEKTAVIHDDRSATYAKLNNQSNSLAQYLQANGITKGDRIALLLENGIDYIIAYYAALKLGAVVTPLNPGLKPDGFQYLIRDLNPAVIIASFKSERLLKAVTLSDLCTIKLLLIRKPTQKWDNIPFAVSALEEGIEDLSNVKNPSNPVDPKDLACIIYTSGSTGKPKGVMLSNSNIVANTISICQSLSISENDIQMVVLPFFYVMGKSLLNTHIAAGGTIVINNKFLFPADVVHQMVEERVTAFSGVPSTYAYLLNRSPLAACRNRLSSLRYCSQAGGHMAKSIKVALRKALPEKTQIVIMYGATEASARIAYLDPTCFNSKMMSIGKAIPDVSIRILDENGCELSHDKEGELVVRGENIMLGYWKDPKTTAYKINGQGFHTGDMGYRDSDGFLYITHRRDNLLKVGGHRINPIEIEDFLMSTNMFIESVVVGLPDELLGNKLVALVVPLVENFEPNVILKKCAHGLPKHKCPKTLLPVRTLPKSANGKIDRKKCIDLALEKSR